MAVTLTDHRTIWNEADSITGWTGSPTLFTADPDPVESTGSIGYVVSTATVDAFFTGSSTDLTNKLVYVWTLPRGAMDTLANGGISIHVGDGTDRMAYHVGGSNYAGFRHTAGPSRWENFVLDQGNLPTAKTTRAGAEGSLGWNAITQIGATFKTLAKSVGGASNCFVDIIRIGDLSVNNGCVLSVTGGTSGDPGTFAQIAAADQSTANQVAHGLVRELAPGLYGVQGPLRFGNATGTAASWFEDKNAAVSFESRGLRTTVYGIYITDNGTGTTTFKLGTKVGTGSSATGADGCTLLVPSGVGAYFNSGSDTDVTDVFVYGTLFSGFTGGITTGAGQEFIDDTFAGCGTITATNTYLMNSTVSGSTVSANTSSLIWNNNTDPSGYLDGMSFSKGAAAHHAIEFGTSSPTTMTLNGLSFTGFGTSNNANDSVLHIKRTTGTVTINLVGVSGTVSYRTDGATVNLVNSTSLTLTGLKNPTEVRVFNAGTTTAIAGQEDVTTGTFTTGIDAATYTSVDISIISLGYQNLRILGVDVTSDISIPIQQVLDRQYLNP